MTAGGRPQETAAYRVSGRQEETTVTARLPYRGCCLPAAESDGRRDMARAVALRLPFVAAFGNGAAVCAVALRACCCGCYLLLLLSPAFLPSHLAAFCLVWFFFLCTFVCTFLSCLLCCMYRLHIPFHSLVYYPVPHFPLCLAFTLPAASSFMHAFPAPCMPHCLFTSALPSLWFEDPSKKDFLCLSGGRASAASAFPFPFLRRRLPRRTPAARRLSPARTLRTAPAAHGAHHYALSLPFSASAAPRLLSRAAYRASRLARPGASRSQRGQTSIWFANNIYFALHHHLG